MDREPWAVDREPWAVGREPWAVGREPWTLDLGAKIMNSKNDYHTRSIIFWEHNRS